jgi:hypothetical protein
VTDRTWEELIEDNENADYGEAWIPDQRDQPATLVGTVRSYNLGPESQWSGERPWICNIEDRHGQTWSVWLNRDILVREFSDQRPEPGERIVVRYRGRSGKASRTGASPAHLYTVTVDRERRLPGFLTAPALEAGEQPVGSDVPVDREFDEGFAEAARRGQVDVPDADVVEEDDDDLPFD